MKVELELPPDKCEEIVIREMSMILDMESEYFGVDADRIKLAAATIMNYYQVPE